MKILLGMLLFAGNFMSQTEEPEYTVIESKGDIEIRDYAPMIVAEVEVSGERKEAINEGFKILADYIFGNSASNEKMAMTAPVLQQKSMEKWKVKFVIEKKYTFETTPQPNSKEVNLIQLPKKRFAVIQFSGTPKDDTIQEHKERLEKYIKDENLKTTGGAIFAFYNPPWTLPFMRRNEVMIEVK